MAYVVTYGHLFDPQHISCETAAEALDAVLQLKGEAQIGIMVSSFEAVDEAIQTLRHLAKR